MIGIAGAGLLAICFIKEIPLITHTDENFGLVEDRRPVPDEEKTVTGDLSPKNTKN